MSDGIKLLKRVGAVLSESHFVGTSGLHFATYINKDALYPHTTETSLIGKRIAEQNRTVPIEVVVGPALGGIILSQWVAHHLSVSQESEVLSVYAEKMPDGGLTVNRGYDALVRGKQVLLVEDIITTGESAKKAMSAVRAAGGLVVGLAVIVNKNPSTVTKEYMEVSEFTAVCDISVPTYSKEECPLCKANIPIDTRVGHGKKFLESHKQ